MKVDFPSDCIPTTTSSGVSNPIAKLYEIKMSVLKLKTCIVENFSVLTHVKCLANH